MKNIAGIIARDLAAQHSHSADGVAQPTPIVTTALVVGAFSALVIFGATHHVMWRDEVRALSMATGGSFLDIVPTIRNEGHPALWYLLLFAASQLLGGSRLALPIVSLLVAISSAWLFVRHAPFALWHRILFIFGLMPAFVYAVMNRNYGISMLLLFSYCSLGRSRRSRPIVAGSILALLANTNAHSVVLTAALVAAWVLGELFPNHPDWRGPSRGRTAIGVTIALLGCALCALQIWPQRSSSIETVASEHAPMASEHLMPMPEAVNVAPSVLAATPTPATAHETARAGTSAAARAVRAATALFDPAILNPGRLFVTAFGTELLPDVLGPVAKYHIGWVLADVIFISVAFMLASSPNLLAAHALSLAGLSVLFTVVYPGQRRHQGLEYLFIIALLWLWMEEGTRTPRRVKWLGPLLSVMLVLNVVGAMRAYRRELRQPQSSAAALAEWLDHSTEFKRAIFVAEPDFVLETLPYYMRNRLYVVREGRFARWTVFTEQNRKVLSLHELLTTMTALQEREHVPVLLLFSFWSQLEEGPATAHMGYNRKLTWSAAQRAEFLARTHRVTDLSDAYSNERYAVVALNTDSAKAPPRAP